MSHGVREAPRTATIRASRCCSRGAACGELRLGLARRAQRRQRAGRAGGGASRRRADRARHRRVEPLQRRGAAHAVARRRPPACRCTTILRTTRPRSPPPSMGCAAGSALQRIIAVLEPRSQTMRLGVHQQTLAAVTGRGGRGMAVRAAVDRAGMCAAPWPRSARVRSSMTDLNALVDGAGAQPAAAAITC